jgi:hypothetical protein
MCGEFAVLPVGGIYFVQMGQRAVDRGEVAAHDGFASLAVGLAGSLP